MTETIREIDIGPEATIALPTFTGAGAAERSVSRFCHADLPANSRAPPSPARSRRAHSPRPHSHHTRKDLVV
jgi:hypothetical protein